MWKRLVHPNIVPFKGVSIDPPQIVSEWMPNGDLTTYIKSNPQRDPVSLVSLLLCFPDTSLQLSPAGRRRKWPRLPPLSGRDPRRSEGGEYPQAPVSCLPHRFSAAEHSRGRFWQRSYHRFCPRSTYLTCSFHGRTPEYAVDCTRGISGDRSTEYGSGCFLVRNGCG